MNIKKKYSTLDTQEKCDKLIVWLDERKAKNIISLNLIGRSSCTDTMIIASASSQRHARSLADECLEFCKEHNFEFLRMEGYQEGDWVLLDLNDVIIHIFQQTIRETYNLEALWREVPDVQLAQPI